MPTIARRAFVRPLLLAALILGLGAAALVAEAQQVSAALTCTPTHTAAHATCK